jgi:hypothetical protein
MKSFSAFITEKKKPEKPQGVNQADVSKDAANYRRAQRQRNATGGPTTGRTGSKSFPGDRSGAYAKAKSDLEARKGFSGSKSGGLKADESNPNVNRNVRNQRTVKQGIPDPFKTKNKAPENPFKGLKTGGKSQIPDPFKSATSVPELKLQGPARAKPFSYSTAGPASKQAFERITKSSQRLRAAGVRGIKNPFDSGEERIGGDTAPPRKPRTSGKPTSASVSNARASGDFRVASVKPSSMGPETKKSAITRELAAAKPETRKLYRASPRSSSFKEFSRQATSFQKKLKSNNPSLSPAGKSTGVQRSSALAKQSPNPMRQGAFDAFMNRVDKAKVKVDEPKGLPSGKKSLPGTIDVTPKSPKPPKAPKPSSIKLPPARKTPALAAAGKSASNAEKIVNRTLGKIGKGTSRALGIGATGVDAFLNYRKYRNQGDSRLKSGLKSAFRTSVGWLGGAAGSALGSFAGPVGTIGGGVAGYSAGTWLADKVLGTTKKKRETAKK